MKTEMREPDTTELARVQGGGCWDIYQVNFIVLYANGSVDIYAHYVGTVCV
jgi:hypothetical protein